MDEIYCVLIFWPDAMGTNRLGPYFSIQAARNQASRAKHKGADVLGIESAHVTWKFKENIVNGGD